LVGVEADLARGQHLDQRAGRITLRQWSEQWLARPGKRNNSVARDRQGLEVFMKRLGSRPLSSITPLHVQAAVDARGRVVAPATVTRDVAALRAVLNAAVDADLIWRSPARKVALPKVRPPDRELLSPNELIRLAAAVPARYRALILVAGVLGLRWGEAIGLRVCDVDFAEGTVSVNQVIEEVAGQVQVLPGVAKTDESLRTIAAPAFLMDELARHLKEHLSAVVADGTALLFVGPRGGILRRRFAERTFRPAIEKAKLDPSITFHGLRHVAMSTLVDANVHPRVMRKRAGHSTYKMTEKYAHVAVDTDRDAADALEDRFRGPLRDSYGHVAGTEHG
jgi:integrase